MIEEAVQAVKDAIDSAWLDRGDGQPLNVTDFMPIPGAMDKPVAVAVYFDSMVDTEFGVVVSIVADTSSDPTSAERLTRSLTEAIDTALDAVPAPRSAWRKLYAEQYAAYIVETTLQYPRDDF